MANLPSSLLPITTLPLEIKKCSPANATKENISNCMQGLSKPLGKEGRNGFLFFSKNKQCLQDSPHPLTPSPAEDFEVGEWQ